MSSIRGGLYPTGAGGLQLDVFVFSLQLDGPDNLGPYKQHLTLFEKGTTSGWNNCFIDNRQAILAKFFRSLYIKPTGIRFFFYRRYNHVRARTIYYK